MNLKKKLFLAKFFPVFMGILGGGIVSAIFLEKSGFFPATLAFILWGTSLKYGAKIRDLVANRSELNPSWSSSLIISLLVCHFLFYFFGYNTIENWTLYLLAINLAYLGAKYRCNLYMCCQKKRNKRRFINGRSLPIIEMIITILIILFTIAVILSQSSSLIVVYIIFSSHILLRLYACYQRFPNKNFLHLIKDYTLLLPILLFTFIITLSNYGI